ncbi:MAG: aldo/keto reductase [Eubacteriales bacterium]|nr:aldo/keto reductase [Eubacteriales bacterium]
MNKASKICYGTLSLSPLQCSYSLQEKTSLLLYAFQKGINFFDTAELYGNYDILRELIKNINRKDIYISTKSYAYSRDTLDESILKALTEMGTDYLDVFMIHEQESIHTFRGHYTAIERLQELKALGVVKNIGISTHFHEAVRDVGTQKEVDIIHPIFNEKGIGIVDGNISQMKDSLKLVKSFGKKVLGMKPLGGGHLTDDPIRSLRFSFESPLIDWTAVGMRYREEIDFNLSVLNNDSGHELLLDSINRKPRRLDIAEWCSGCGACLSKCQHGALQLIDGKCLVDPDKCVLCSYCATACRDFCIKII